MVKCGPCKDGQHEECRERFVVMDAGTDLARMVPCTCNHEPDKGPDTHK